MHALVDIYLASKFTLLPVDFSLMRLLSGFLQFIFMDISKNSSKDKALESIQELLKVQALLPFFSSPLTSCNKLFIYTNLEQSYKTSKSTAFVFKAFLLLAKFPSS